MSEADRTCDAEEPEELGEPPDLTDKVRRTITWAMGKNQNMEFGAALAGVDGLTLCAWLETGARSRNRLGRGATRSDLTEHESRCVDLVHGVIIARAGATATAYLRGLPREMYSARPGTGARN